MVKLQLQFQGAVIKEYPVTKNEITVGRLQDNDIVIDYPAVSGHHCKITLAGDTYYVEDLNSTNGVFVNAAKTLKSGLKNNDVIGIVKHALKFVDERPQGDTTKPPTPPPGKFAAEATMMISPTKQQELAAASTTAAQKRPAVVRVMKGAVDKMEYELSARSTYFGKSDHVQVKIKGTGLFGSAPENAAMIANHPEGYFLVPVKEGYPRLNGKAVNQKEPLKDGDQIVIGGTTFVFEDRQG
jgi:pSer/pThr/pTyr-binding forkhead associated (FHA) protein